MIGRILSYTGTRNPASTFGRGSPDGLNGMVSSMIACCPGQCGKDPLIICHIAIGLHLANSGRRAEWCGGKAFTLEEAN